MAGDRRDGHGLSGGMFIVVTALMGMGLVAVASSTTSLDQPLFSSGFWKTPLGRQVIFVLAGIVLMVTTGRVALWGLRSERMRWWGPRVLFVLTILGLVAAMIPKLAGYQGHSLRWLRLDLAGTPVGVQPSELAKLAMVALLASVLTERHADPRLFRRCFVPASLVLGVLVALVGKADFGTAVLISVVGISMLFVAGCRLRHLALLGALGMAGLTGLLILEPYRVERLTAYLNFGGDPQGTGYQALQSLATVASGGWLGTGLGLGVQQYGYLPACHTDFIFAVICEEMGVLGGALVIVLFAWLIWLGMRAMVRATSRFERLLAFGITATIGLQAVMNIAVVTALAPTTGISLPFISVGGSGLLMFAISFGLLWATARKGENRASVAELDTVEVATSPPSARIPTPDRAERVAWSS